VNRWSRWAQQLRGRHGRRAGLHASGSMVIASRPGSLVQILCAGPRTILHVHAHLRVTRDPGPRLIGVRPDYTRPAIGMTARAPVVTVTTAAQPAVPLADIAPATPADRPAAPAFLTVPELRTRRVMHETRTASHVVHIHDLVRQWRQSPADRVRALELVTRLRAGSVRQELPVPERAGVVARLRPPAAERQSGIMPPALSPGVPSERIPSPAIAPVNVETLTTQVIQQLDRRLIAYRERMGRV
jgi:hypothetical protein